MGEKNRILTWVFWLYFVTKRIPLMCLPVSQFSSVIQSRPTLCNPMCYTCVHRVGDAIHCLFLCHPILLLYSIFPSIGVFSHESVFRIRWPDHWSFSFSISTSNEYSGLISFRMDWFYLLLVQGTLKSILQHHNSRASVLWCPVFFIVPLSHP